jgi:predicted RNase H-like HicB family nuclease
MTAALPSPEVYTYRVEWSSEDGEFMATVAEFPSLTWLARTPEMAEAGLKGIVHRTVLDIRDNGGVVPAPLPRPFRAPQPPPTAYPTFPMPTVSQSVNVSVGGRYRPRCNHTFHLLMSLITCGLWAPIWAIDWAIKETRR